MFNSNVLKSMQILNTLFDVNSTTVIEESGDFNYEFNLMHFTQQLLLLKEYNNMSQQNLTVELYIPHDKETDRI